jgi:hypothetical protein
MRMTHHKHVGDLKLSVSSSDLKLSIYTLQMLMLDDMVGDCMQPDAASTHQTPEVRERQRRRVTRSGRSRTSFSRFRIDSTYTAFGVPGLLVAWLVGGRVDVGGEHCPPTILVVVVCQVFLRDTVQVLAALVGVVRDHGLRADDHQLVGAGVDSGVVNAPMDHPRLDLALVRCCGLFAENGRDFRKAREMLVRG